MNIPKGAYSGECNRTAGDNRPALYWNRYTHAFYCLPCARKLNEVFKRDGMDLIPINRPTEPQSVGEP